MSEVSDEMLMAYVDGELAPAERERLAALIERDPELRRRVAVFAETARVLEQAFAPVVEQPVSERLLRAARGNGSSAAAQTRTKASGAGRRRTAGARPFRPGQAVALAACLVLGIALGRLVPFDLATEPPTGSPVPFATGSAAEALQTALESRPSGATERFATTASGDMSGRITPLASFRDRAERWCREFEAVLPGGSDSRAVFGVACRHDDGRWQTEVLITEAPAPAATDETGYGPASGSTDTAIESLIDRMMKNAPLTPGEETQRLETGWQ